MRQRKRIQTAQMCLEWKCFVLVALNSNNGQQFRFECVCQFRVWVLSHFVVSAFTCWQHRPTADDDHNTIAYSHTFACQHTQTLNNKYSTGWRYKKIINYLVFKQFGYRARARICLTSPSRTPCLLRRAREPNSCTQLGCGQFVRWATILAVTSKYQNKIVLIVAHQNVNDFMLTTILAVCI